MRKQSIKQMADDIIARKIEQWRHAAAANPENKFDTTHFKLKMNGWLDTVSGMADEVIQAAIASGTTLEVDGCAELPSNLHIIKSRFTAAVAAAWVDAHDKRKSHHIPDDKMFEPSLFPALDYDEARQQWLVLGDTDRVRVGDATNEQWRVSDNIKIANFEDQERAINKNKEIWKRREALFRANPDCLTTDALMKKLGAWRT